MPDPIHSFVLPVLPRSTQPPLRFPLPVTAFHPSGTTPIHITPEHSLTSPMILNRVYCPSGSVLNFSVCVIRNFTSVPTAGWLLHRSPPLILQQPFHPHPHLCQRTV